MGRRILKISGWLLAAVILLLSTAALLVPFAIQRNASYIEAYLSKQLQRPVKIQSIGLKWEGLMPVLAMEDVKVGAKNFSPLLSIHEISVGVRLIPSLAHREILLKYIFVEGLNLSFIRDTAGKWQLEGFPALPSSSSSSLVVKNAITIEGKNISLNIRDVFPNALSIQHLKTKIIFQKTPAGRMVTLKNFTAQNADIKLSGNAVFHTPENNIDLKIHYALMPSIASTMQDYLPENLLHPKLKQWLKQAVKSIDAAEGVFVLQGKLSDFPYTDKPGQFLIDMQLKNMQLAYDPEWPEAVALNGQLIFHNDSLALHKVSAQISGIPVTNIEVNIPHFGEESVLNIQGKILTHSQSLLHFIQQSPLQKTIGKYMEGYTLTGPAQLQLGIIIPLGERAKPVFTQVSGRLNLTQNKFKFSRDMTVDAIKADIHFNQDGVTGKTLTGMLEKKPFTLTILPQRYLVHYDQWQFNILDRGNKNWQININHPETAGVVTIRNNDISGRFDKLYIADDQSHLSHTTTLQPQKIPSLDMMINDFQYHAAQFGRVAFKTVPIHGGLALQALQASLGKTRITMTGQWIGRRSSIAGRLTSQDMLETLKNWGLSSSMESQSAFCDYQLQWPDVIYSPDLQNLQGNIHFSIGKGQILNIGSRAKMDIGRLLTLLSFQSVASRLKLDFADLRATGLNFDSLTGDFQFNNGLAITQNTRLKGPIASILMTGSIDMVNQTYQLKLLVKPHLTSSLPIIATIAGGPVAGAAAWAADRLFKPLLNKITMDTYTITGPWDKPVIK